MHIVVLTKNVPDTEATVTVDAGGAIDWGNKLVINPWDEYAITEAVLLKEVHNGTITVMTVGPAEHEEALKQGLAVGCDQAIRIWVDALGGYDSLVYARAVAAAIRKLDDVDLVIFGKELSDIASDQHIFQTARKLGWNLVSFVAKIDTIDFSTKTIRAQRLVEQGTQVITDQLPAVISVIKDINEPKYPTFIGIRKAAKAEILVWGAAELDLEGDALAPKVAVSGYQALPQREGSVTLIDGATAQEKAEKLADLLLEEKIL